MDGELRLHQPVPGVLRFLRRDVYPLMHDHARDGIGYGLQAFAHGHRPECGIKILDKPGAVDPDEWLDFPLVLDHPAQRSLVRVPHRGEIAPTEKLDFDALRQFGGRHRLVA